MSYRVGLETKHREETPFFSRIVPRGLSVAEAQYTALHNATHFYSDQDPWVAAVKNKKVSKTAYVRIKRQENHILYKHDDYSFK